MYFAYGKTELDALSAKDPKLAAVIAQVGIVQREVDADLFSAVVHHIIGQQISTKAQILTHTTFCIPYVFINVKSRLIGMDPALSEAARDLGANPMRVLKDITLPLVFPAVLSGMMLSAAMSLDDVVISFFVTSAETTTLPLKVYTGLRSGGTPEINALSTLMLGVIFICVALSQFLTAKSNAKLK